ncbi:hypothetical protein QVD17_12044 [Tagetes erecta]|uniref:Uncharacterized protein n=1 Tax=Tagetes erecta TaxID=13708 RepID=A0AAD8KW88_TARER|nr:hypothetical protein QVD17_12044 [Tagetes erecta]
MEKRSLADKVKNLDGKVKRSILKRSNTVNSDEVNQNKEAEQIRVSETNAGGKKDAEGGSNYGDSNKTHNEENSEGGESKVGRRDDHQHTLSYADLCKANAKMRQ